MVGALSGLPVRHVNFDAPGDKLVAVGSIAHAIRGGRAVLWGPGVSIRGGVLADNVKLTEYDVRALRGGGRVWKFEGRAMVDGELACEAQFMAMFDVPKP